jgi:hypothetical protein
MMLRDFREGGGRGLLTEEYNGCAVCPKALGLLLERSYGEQKGTWIACGAELGWCKRGVWGLEATQAWLSSLIGHSPHPLSLWVMAIMAFKRVVRFFINTRVWIGSAKCFSWEVRGA